MDLTKLLTKDIGQQLEKEQRSLKDSIQECSICNVLSIDGHHICFGIPNEEQIEMIVKSNQLIINLFNK